MADFLNRRPFPVVFLMGRSLIPALKKSKEDRHLLVMFFIAAIAIPLFYVPGLIWGQQTHLSMAEYWRWWVVHLWVEGFFEVFATVVIAFLFTRMGLSEHQPQRLLCCFPPLYSYLEE